MYERIFIFHAFDFLKQKIGDRRKNSGNSWSWIEILTWLKIIAYITYIQIVQREERKKGLVLFFNNAAKSCVNCATIFISIALYFL